MKIYNLGSLNVDYVYTVDHFVSAGETESSNGRAVFPGGKGLNQSVALARAGAKVIHGAVVGDEGDLLLDALSQSGVDISRIEKRSGSCGHTIIQVDKTGQNCILLFPGTNHAIDRRYIERFLADAQEDDVLVLQNEISNLQVAFEVAHRKKMRIAMNPSPYHDSIKQLPLSYVKWWFCNEIEGEALFGGSQVEQIAAVFRERYPDSCLILTLGSEGSVLIDGDACIRQSAFRVQVVDTTAAGDTFTGYFLASVTGGKEAAYGLELAAKAAAVTVSRPGASSSIPWLREVEEQFG